ncbi:hypothetical protein ACS0TY_030233 [Phlomoides rotata]
MKVVLNYPLESAKWCFLDCLKYKLIAPKALADMTLVIFLESIVITLPFLVLLMKITIMASISPCVLDYCSHHPESLHTFTFFCDDVGIPQDYRHMEGFGVHTFTLINKAGKVNYVKFHWKPTCGVKCLLEKLYKLDEAIKFHSYVTNSTSFILHEQQSIYSCVF